MTHKKRVKDSFLEGKLYIVIAPIIVWYHNKTLSEDLLLKDVKTNEVLLFCEKIQKNENLVKLKFLLKKEVVYLCYVTNTRLKNKNVFNKLKELT